MKIFPCKSFKFYYDISRSEFKLECYGVFFELNIYELHLLKLTLNGLITKIKEKSAPLHVITTITNNLKFTVDLEPQHPPVLKFVDSSGPEYSVTYSDIVCFHSFLECLCIAIPIVENLQTSKQPQIIDIPEKNNQKIAKVDGNLSKSNNTESQSSKQDQKTEPSNFDIEKFEEICNILILTNKDKLSDDHIEQLRSLIKEYLGIQDLPSASSLKITIETVSDEIQKRLKDESIFEVVNSIHKPEFEQYIKKINETTSRSDRLRKIVTLFFVKELKDAISIMNDISTEVPK